MSTEITNLLNSSTNYNPGEAQGTSELGKDDFLMLMIEQIKNQDPLDPMDGSEYAAQLAQFTSLEQLTNLNEAMENSINANYVLTQSINNTMTATLIGNDAKISGLDFAYSGQDEIQLGYELPSSAKSATIKIYNESGALVHTISNLETTAGDHKLSWDFTDNSGKKMAEGEYSFKVEATSATGEDMTVTAYQYGTIEGIRYTEDGAYLTIGGNSYMPSDILEIIRPNSGE